MYYIINYCLKINFIYINWILRADECLVNHANLEISFRTLILDSSSIVAEHQWKKLKGENVILLETQTKWGNTVSFVHNQYKKHRKNHKGIQNNQIVSEGVCLRFIYIQYLCSNVSIPNVFMN